MNTRIEDAITAANNLAEHLYGADSALDGGGIAANLSTKVGSISAFEQLLSGIPAQADGRQLLYFNENRTIESAKPALIGRTILSPRSPKNRVEMRNVNGKNIPLMFPAIVAFEQPAAGLRVLVTDQPFVGNLSPATGIILAGELQARDPSIGTHDKGRNGLDAGHFTTLLTTAVNSDINAQVQSGNHVVHDWKAGEGIVVGAARSGLFTANPGMITLTGAEPIAWHESLAEYTAALPNGLLLVQGLGFMATEAVENSGEILRQAAPAMETSNG